jgi:hypothetical protein
MCNKRIDDDSKYCAYCGAPQNLEISQTVIGGKLTINSQDDRKDIWVSDDFNKKVDIEKETKGKAVLRTFLIACIIVLLVFLLRFVLNYFFG